MELYVHVSGYIGEDMTPEQALNVLSQATEPNVKLTRGDYVLINQALVILSEFIKNHKLIAVPANEKVSDNN